MLLISLIETSRLIFTNLQQSYGLTSSQALDILIHLTSLNSLISHLTYYSFLPYNNVLDVLLFLVFSHQTCYHIYILHIVYFLTNSIKFAVI